MDKWHWLADIFSVQGGCSQSQTIHTAVAPLTTMTSRKTSDEARSNVHISFQFLCMPNKNFLVPFAASLLTRFSCSKNWCRPEKQKKKYMFPLCRAEWHSTFDGSSIGVYYIHFFFRFPIVICMTRTVSHKYPDRPMNLVASMLPPPPPPLPSSVLHSLEKYESWNTFYPLVFDVHPSRRLLSLPSIGVHLCASHH